MESSVFFHYKTQETFLHRLNPALKIILIFFLALAAFYLPVKVCLAVYPILLLFSVLVLKFTLSEVRADASPLLAYIFLLYFATVLANTGVFLNEGRKDFFSIFKPNLTYFPLLARLALSLEITSIFYRTTSTGQFKAGFASLEMFITRKDSAPFSDTLALAVSFIPRISVFWKRLENAWISRGGKNNLTKALYLFPKLFHVSLREGYEKSLAIQNRSL